MNKALIFVTGLVVGVVAGTVTTVLCYDHQKKKLDSDIDAARKYYIDKLRSIGWEVVDTNEIVTESVEEMKDYYIQELHNLGYDMGDYRYDNSVEEQKTIVNPVDDEEEEESEEESDTYPVDPNPDPYEISSREHGTKEFYDTEVLQYYKGDGQMTDSNYEFIDDWQQHVGYIEDRLKSETADSIYIRNEVEQTDYEILIYDDSYAHAVEGEPLGDMAD